MRIRTITISIGLLSFAVGALTSCSRTDTKPVAAAVIKELVSPAGPNSAQPNLAVGPNGETFLSWIETGDDGVPALKFAEMKDEQWSPAQSIIQSEDLIVNYADFPSLLPMNGGMLAAHWMTAIPKSDGYRINVAFSHDGGKSWSKPVVPHRDHTPNEHGFVSMTPTPDGGIGAIWLDSRKLKRDEGDVAMMYTSVGQDGRLGPEVTIDGRVCECCQPSAVRTPNGLLAVYRDRSDKEIRDIAIVRFDGAKWTEPKNIFADNWMILGCPINGPAIASHENQVVVAWFTAPDNKPKVEVAFSPDGGNSFASPVQIDEGNPMGRVGVVALDSGGTVVTWLERSDKESQLRARQIDKDGKLHPSVIVGTTSAGTSGGFPRVGHMGNVAIIAWTDTNTGRVRVSALDSKN
jgi:hypothetical protein